MTNEKYLKLASLRNNLIKPQINTDKINLKYILKSVFYPCESVAKKNKIKKQ